MKRKNNAEILAHLRDPQIIYNVIIRHRVKQSTRQYFCTHDFVEVDTPVLGNPLDEYTRNHFTVQGRGGLYALPQSPQLYKQLIVMCSLERYFQFPHCFRDEEYDPHRTDQVPEHIQIDFELRTKSAIEVRSVAENLVAAVCAELNVPCSVPFPTIDAVECVQKYGTDKPDLRYSSEEYAFLWVVNFPIVEVSADNKMIPTHHPFALPILEESEGLLENLESIRTDSYDLVLNGMEIGGGDLRIHSEELQKEVIRRFGFEESQFALLLEALRERKLPPHGGMAIGLDRLVMQLAKTRSISDVNFF